MVLVLVSFLEIGFRLLKGDKMKKVEEKVEEKLGELKVKAAKFKEGWFDQLSKLFNHSSRMLIMISFIGGFFIADIIGAFTVSITAGLIMLLLDVVLYWFITSTVANIIPREEKTKEKEVND